ncbi:Adenylyl-sulfate kinase OS=Streptomyces fumanus OX=67302 GN=cysC PE=3 SV=1 [Streptomyces fumanus]
MQRIGLVSEVLARNGVLSVVPVIAPYADSREAVLERHEASGTPYIEVHVATPVEVWQRAGRQGCTPGRPRAG